MNHYTIITTATCSSDPVIAYEVQSDNAHDAIDKAKSLVCGDYYFVAVGLTNIKKSKWERAYSVMLNSMWWHES